MEEAAERATEFKSTRNADANTALKSKQQDKDKDKDNYKGKKDKDKEEKEEKGGKEKGSKDSPNRRRAHSSVSQLSFAQLQELLYDYPACALPYVDEVSNHMYARNEYENSNGDTITIIQ